MHSNMLQWISAKTNSFFLVQNWNTGTITGLTSALLTSIFIASLYEGLSYYGHLQRTIAKENRSSTDGKSSSIKQHCCRTISHMLQLTMGYILMLSVMTYNMWMLVSVVVGAGVGHFVVRPFVAVFVYRGRGNYYVNGIPEGNSLLPHVSSAQTGNGCETKNYGHRNIIRGSYRKTELNSDSCGDYLLNKNINSAKNKNIERIAEIEKSLNSTICHKTPNRLEGLLRETDSLKAIRSYKNDDSDLSKMSEFSESYLSRSYTSGISKQSESQFNINIKDSQGNMQRSYNASNHTENDEKYIVLYNVSGNIKANTSGVTIVERDSENPTHDNLWNRHC